LLRLRNEVGQLRQAAKQRASERAAPPAGTGQAAANPGRYISKDQLAFADYATPEAALQSMAWAMVKGTFEQTVAALKSEEQPDELSSGKEREEFETNRKIMEPFFKGLQIVARKTLAEDRVELKYKMDSDPIPNNNVEMPRVVIQPFVKIGTEWKVGGSTRAYQDNWDQDGQIQPLTP